MTAAHYAPGDDRDEHRAALYGAPELDDRPQPHEYEGSADPVRPLPGCDTCGSAWRPPLCNCDAICPSCDRNEMRRGQVICSECQDERLQDEKHDRSRGGEWHES